MAANFLQTYTGRLHSVLHWEQLEALWQLVRNSAENGWYAYEIGAQCPAQPLDSVALIAFIEQADAFLRTEHEAEYCGVVYTDNFDTPSLLKIYHPKKMGTGCGASRFITLPRWTLSTAVPIDLLDWAAEKQEKPPWWKQMLKGV